MAQFANITPPEHSTVYSQNLTYNNSTYGYYGNVVLAADEGWKFDNDTTYQMYRVTLADTSLIDGVISNDQTRCTFTIPYSNTKYGNLNAAVAFLGELVSDSNVITVPLTQTLSNCTTNAPTEITSNDTILTITCTPSSGYEFTSSPKIEFLDQNNDIVLDNNGNYAIYTANANGVITVTVSDIDLTAVDTVILTATAIEIIVAEISIIERLQHCTTNAPSTITENTANFSITVTPSSGYEFNSARLEILDVNQEVLNTFTATEKGIINVNVSAINFEEAEYAILTAVCTEIIVITDIPITQNLTNCATNAPQYITENDTVINIVATANSGYQFENAPQLYILDTDGNPHVFNFTIAANSLTAELTFSVADFGFSNLQTVELTASANVVTPYSDKYGNVNVYRLTENNLKDFGEKRFFNEVYDTQSSQPQYKSVDLGNYVASVKRVYFPIGDTIADVLKCGNYNTKIPVTTPLNDTITVDCGNVLIPSPNNNATDYNSEITVFLPFVGLHSISTDYIGREIKLEYVCNIVTANAVAKLYCNDIPFDFIECSAANDLIYRTSESYSEYANRGVLSFNMTVLKGLTPYVVVKSFVDENKQIYNNDNARVVIGDCTGFNKFEQVIGLSNGILNAEYVTIIEELEKGVFIN